jgi:hypothetical protein
VAAGKLRNVKIDETLSSKLKKQQKILKKNFGKIKKQVGVLYANLNIMNFLIGVLTITKFNMQ